jgi:hypothetical protein
VNVVVFVVDGVPKRHEHQTVQRQQDQSGSVPASPSQRSVVQ